MLYEKKMLILSGDGKGVVLIEKGGNGSTFSLRTFDLPGTVGLKAGIITKTAVFVRDLPEGRDPSARFTVDAGDISELHFAVFDKRLRLYGTNAKRMWEANLMDILQKHDRTAAVARPEPAPLPPLAPAAAALPLPDGTGIPQSRLSVYGDEAIAQSDFYTPLDFTSRMSQVDKFLDTPRVLDGLAPRVVPPPNIAARDLVAAETTAAVIAPSVDLYEADEEESDGFPEENETVGVVETVSKKEEDDIEEEVNTVDEQTETVLETTGDAVSGTEYMDSEKVTEEPKPGGVSSADTIAKTEKREVEPSYALDVAQSPNTSMPESAAADVTSENFGAVEREMPWEITASWLKNRTKRDLKIRRESVRKLKTDNDRVRYLRESAFFERVRSDVETLFSSAPQSEALKKLLPDIDWIKVEFDGNVISVGRSDNTFLCYAVAGTYRKSSPLGDEAQWLPADKQSPTADGYWLIFQSLESGEILRQT